MVVALTSSGAGTEVVVGQAGTLKTYALDAARQIWEASGVPVAGAALAARAAAELTDGASIPASTLAALLIDVDRPGPDGGLRPGSVLVVDEAAMVGTRQLARLLDAAGRHGTKLVLCGDPRPLPEIEAGGVMAALAALPGAIQLTGNRRQRRQWERDALTELRAGDPKRALAA